MNFADFVFKFSASGPVGLGVVGKNQALGLGVILSLSKLGVNENIAKGQNRIADFGQKIVDTFGITDHINDTITVLGKTARYSDKEIDYFKNNFVKYTRPDTYKATRADVEIFEVSAYQAYLVYQRTGDQNASLMAFLGFEMGLHLYKRRTEIKQGKSFNIASAVRNIFGSIPYAGTFVKEILRELEPNDYEDNAGDIGFDNVRETFFNDLTNGLSGVSANTDANVALFDNFKIPDYIFGENKIEPLYDESYRFDEVMKLEPIVPFFDTTQGFDPFGFTN